MSSTHTSNINNNNRIIWTLEDTLILLEKAKTDRKKYLTSQEFYANEGIFIQLSTKFTPHQLKNRLENCMREYRAVKKVGYEDDSKLLVKNSKILYNLCQDYEANYQCSTIPKSVIKVQQSKVIDVLNEILIVQKELAKNVNAAGISKNLGTTTTRKCQQWLQNDVKIQDNEYKQSDLDDYRKLLLSIRNIPLTMKSFVGLKKYKHEIDNFLDNNIMTPSLFYHLNKIRTN